jgi:hypothetical protein
LKRLLAAATGAPPPRYIPLVDAESNRPPVEVKLGKQCPHGCFWIQVGSETIWHIPGVPSVNIVQDGQVYLHTKGCAGEPNEEGCLCDEDRCFGSPMEHQQWDN